MPEWDRIGDDDSLGNESSWNLLPVVTASNALLGGYVGGTLGLMP
jgi:hypothetical protein